MNEDKKVAFWLDRAVEEIIAARPEGELIVSSGASPSGMYHIGHLREFLTADSLAWGLRAKGRTAKHVHVVDDLDRFRKVPSNVPSTFEQYIGKPLHLVPAPDGSDQSYAQYWFDQIHQAMKAMGAEMEVIFSHERYQSGYFAESIETTIAGIETVRTIIETVSGRQLSSRWSPVQILDDNDTYDTRWFTGIDTEAQTVRFESKDGSTGEVPYTTGRVKLDWRVDWPARWSKLHVAVEPFGRDHATKGGSYDTGKAIVEQLFNAPAPIPYPYEFINLKGQTKKMSASDGSGILPLDALQIMPPEMLKDFVLRSRPSLQLFLDLGVGFSRMFDTFAEAERMEASDTAIDAMTLAKSGSSKLILPELPFNHIVVAWQSGRRDVSRALEILRRSEHVGIVDSQKDLIVSMFPYIDAWLERWAPDALRFVVQDTLPSVELADSQLRLLADLAERISHIPAGAQGEWFHVQVHEIRESHDLQPKEAFEALYKVILNKTSGPKAGWFLSTFEPEWLVKRFREATTQ